MKSEMRKSSLRVIQLHTTRADRGAFAAREQVHPVQHNVM